MTDPETFRQPDPKAEALRKRMLALHDNGGAIPPVDPEDVKKLWEFYESEEKQRSDEGLSQNVAYGYNLIKAVISPGADVMAVSLRTIMLKMSGVVNLLGPRKSGEELDPAVFRVAASWPFEVGMGGVPRKIDPNPFIQKLREETGKD